MSLWDRVLNRLFKCRMSKRRGGVCPKCKGLTPLSGCVSTTGSVLGSSRRAREARRQSNDAD